MSIDRSIGTKNVFIFTYHGGFTYLIGAKIMYSKVGSSRPLFHFIFGLYQTSITPIGIM